MAIEADQIVRTTIHLSGKSLLSQLVSVLDRNTQLAGFLLVVPAALVRLAERA